jgi:VanZ family protein
VPELKRFLDYVVPAILYAGLIFFLSTRPNLPHLPGIGSDKLAHFSEYAVFGILVVRAFYAYRVPPKRAVTVGILICAVYGATDEVHQLFTPGRSSEVWDFVADALGSTAGGLLWYAVVSRLWGFEAKSREY